jgi:hypothetical protein
VHASWWPSDPALPNSRPADPGVRLSEQIYQEADSTFPGNTKPASVRIFSKGYIIDRKYEFAKDRTAILAELANEDKTGSFTFLREVIANDAHYQIFAAIRDRHLNDVSTYRRIQVLYDNKDVEHASFGHAGCHNVSAFV